MRNGLSLLKGNRFEWICGTRGNRAVSTFSEYMSLFFPFISLFSLTFLNSICSKVKKVYFYCIVLALQGLWAPLLLCHFLLSFLPFSPPPYCVLHSFALLLSFRKSVCPFLCLSRKLQPQEQQQFIQKLQQHTRTQNCILHKRTQKKSAF